MAKAANVSHQKRATRAKNHTEVTVKYDSDSEDPTGKAPSAEEENTGPESDGMTDMLTLIQEYQKRKAKQKSSSATLFRREMKTLCASARKNARELTNAEIAMIEGARAQAKQHLRAQHSDPEKDVQFVQQMFQDHDKTMESITSVHRILFDTLQPRRVERIDSASLMMQEAPFERNRSLSAHLRRARTSLETAKAEEKIATDAQELVKHVKAMMRR